MKKRFAKGTFLLLVSFFGMTICCLVMFGTMRTDSRSKENSRRNYSDNAATVVVSECQNDFWTDYFSQDTFEDGVAYTNVWAKDIDVKGVYGRGNFKRPNMISGSFGELFTQSGTKNCAVVGKDLQSMIYVSNGHPFIDFDDITFRVSGIMGTKYESKINSTLYISFGAAMLLNDNTGQVIIDGNSKKKIENNVQDIRSYASDKATFYSDMYNAQTSFIEQIFYSSKLTKYLFALVLGCFWIATIIIVAMWLSYKSNEINIKNMLGFTRSEILGDLTKSYGKITGLGFLLGMIVFVPMIFLSDTITFAWTDIVTSFLLTVVLGEVSLLARCMFAERKRKK